MQIEPQSELVLARGLEDHADSGAYYVQAIVRNAKTDALIATVNLTDRGNRRFTKEWRVASDPTGEGLDILITYTVYTDSGYTTKAENYGEKFDSHRIQHIQRHGGGGGGDINYERIAKIVEKALLPVLKLLSADPKDPDFSPLSGALQAILTEVRANKPEKPNPVSFEPVLAKIEATERSVVKAIANKEVTAKTDLQPVLDAIADFKVDFEPNLTAFETKLDALFTRIKEFLGNDIDQFNLAVQELKQEFSNIAYVTLQGGKQKPNDDQE